MVDEVRAVVDFSAWEARLSAHTERVMSATQLGAVALERVLKAEVRVTPGSALGPVERSGRLRESITVVEHGRSAGVFTFDAGPTAEYSRIIELGIKSRAGRPGRRAPMPWWGPGNEAAHRAVYEFWERLWADALM